ncbi:TRAP transporter substrate-binding protein [Nesterenkonia lutea]|uniref:TRAP-type C4-dicarboxylate transport system substrate-binding protein n=1 Tax=Nesterenkonia lutea TaxID=272919 RepID=A0ABR9JGQ8_9MICC|nr:TRAP transporter substrate-binding protein DctP [Nesterenkonia lutea]MBE1525125.1 TRAP-type C4-dicarboxylate transport system substrate-binding protein [Nesterenkonia lutea]
MFTISKRRRVATAAGAIGALALLAGCSEGVVQGEDGGGEDVAAEETLTLVTAAMDGTPNAAVQDWFLTEVEERSEGRIEFERTEAYSLCDAPEIADCVRDGRAEIGVSIPDYTPVYFPSTSVVSVPFVGQNWQGITHSLHELHRNNADAEAVMTDNNLHFVGTWPVGRMLIGTHEPLESPEDLDGLSTRVSGPLAINLFEGEGTNVVSLAANEVYEGLERGVVDSAAASIDFPVNYRLNELLPYWTDPGVGEYSSFGMWMNLDTYEEMSEDLQQVIDEVAADLAAGAGAEAFYAQATEQCPSMLEAETLEGFTRWDEDITAAWEEETGDSLQSAWVDLATEQGLENAESVLDEYMAGLEELSDPEAQDATLTCIEEFSNQ